MVISNMTYRKTWFSYVLWAAFTGICVMLLTFLGVYLLDANGQTNGVIGMFLLFPVVVIGYLALKESARTVRTRYTMHPHTAVMWEWFFVLLTFALSIIYQFIMAAGYIRLYGEESSVSFSYDTYYFDQAVVRAGSSVEPMIYGAGYLYVLCLSFVMSFLGNKAMSAILLQLLLRILSLIFGYAAARRAAGRFPACIALMCLAAFYTDGTGLIMFDSGCFFFVLYLIGLLSAAGFVKAFCQGGMKRVLAIVGAVFAGMVSGALVYLDLSAVTLFVFWAGIFIGKKGEAKECKRLTGGFRALVYFVTLLSAAAVWFLLFLYNAVSMGSDVWKDIMRWGQMHGEAVFGTWKIMGSLGLLTGNHNYNFVILLSVIVMLAAFLVFEFFKSGREQNYMLWIAVCLFAAPTPATTYGVTPYYGFPLFFWSVLAGLGLQNCIFGERSKALQAVIEESNSEAESAVEEDKEKELQTEEQKSRFIENPLPLPKKHVKKEMDYQYPVDESQMKYDMEVDENDDFDIK